MLLADVMTTYFVHGHPKSAERQRLVLVAVAHEPHGFAQALHGPHTSHTPPLGQQLSVVGSTGGGVTSVQAILPEMTFALKPALQETRGYGHGTRLQAIRRVAAPLKCKRFDDFLTFLTFISVFNTVLFRPD